MQSSSPSLADGHAYPAHPTVENLDHAKLELRATYILRRAEAIEEIGVTPQHHDDENDGWKEIVRRCATAAASVQANAQLKLRSYELRVSHLEEQLALEQTENARLIVSNETLRKQLEDYQASEIAEERVAMNAEDRVLTAEHHLNQLVASRNASIKELATLKRNFLENACEQCRLNLKRKPDAEPATPSARRPTYQSSARHVLENLPTHSPSRSPKEPSVLKPVSKSGVENSIVNDGEESSKNETSCATEEVKTGERMWPATSASAVLSKQKVDFKSHIYVGKMGRGGIRCDR